ncbi:hypothetical protein PAPYR_1015 [Paratrimastix pyriformis]|uniref:Uncharacterized protein n=1 Tax=Paratrimastix pyriformis TaxID=342808 RepID=A0ABQ8UTC0_9EUKA|nr:hypothetical protein PAPYR_1015 [Paratrimastix pyriformis]
MEAIFPHSQQAFADRTCTGIAPLFVFPPSTTLILYDAQRGGVTTRCPIGQVQNLPASAVPTWVADVATGKEIPTNDAAIKFKVVRAEHCGLLDIGAGAVRLSPLTECIPPDHHHPSCILIIVHSLNRVLRGAVLVGGGCRSFYQAKEITRIAGIQHHVAKGLRDPRIRPEDIELLCDGKPLPHSTSLVTVKHMYWKKSEPLILQYRLRAPGPTPSSSAASISITAPPPSS